MILLVDKCNFQTNCRFYARSVYKKIGEGGIDSNTIREHIWNTTGKMPGIYDNGTHYVTNQRLTLETLKKLNDSKHVLEVESFQVCQQLVPQS